MAAVNQALNSAVHQDRLISFQGLQQRLFSQWFNSFIYNQIWEDPRVDLQALQLTKDSEVITIASGGCNVFNYLVEQPKRIVAVDLNPYHLSLARLKLAALQHFPSHELFYAFFGQGGYHDAEQAFDIHLKPQLEQDLAQFWGGYTLLGKRRINFFKQHWYGQTRFGYFMRFLHWIGHKSGLAPEKIIQAKTLQEQEAIFESDIAPFFDNKLVKFLSKLPASVFSLGIPPQQYEAMKREGNLIAQYRKRVKRLACQFPIQDNYFAWQGFSQSYDHEQQRALPEYLKPHHFEQLKQNSQHVETHLGSMIEYLTTQPDNSLDRFVFLDAQDWMSDEVLTQLWTQVARVGKPNSRIIFRTAAAESPLETALPEALRQQFTYHADESATYFQQDRSAIYGGFHLYTMD